MRHKEIQDLIQAHRHYGEPKRERWDRHLQWYRGEFWGKSSDQDGSDAQVAMDTNYLYAYTDSLVAGVVPAHPEVSLDVWYPPLQKSRQTRESLVNTVFRQNQMHRRLWRLSSLSVLCGASYMKATWSPRRKTVRFIPLDPRFVFVDPDAPTWEDNRYVIEAVPMTEAQFKKMSKRKVVKSTGGKTRKPAAMYNTSVAGDASADKFPDWLRAGSLADSGNDTSRERVSSVFKWVLVYEVHDLVEGKMYHVLPNAEKPLMETDLPYNFLPNPYRPLMFNDDLVSTTGISDAMLIDRLMQMLNELDTLQIQHAQACIPLTMVDSTGVQDYASFVQKLAEASSPRDVVPLALKSGRTMESVIGHTMTPPLNPEHHQVRANIIQAIEFVLALPSYNRGVVGQAHIATEVAAAMEAMQTRNGRRVKEVHDMIAWSARATMALYEEFLGKDDVIYAADVLNEPVQVNRGSLLSKDPARSTAYWDDSYFTYKISPYNASDASKPAQLTNLSQFLPTLVQLPEIERGKLIAKLLDMLSINPAEVMKSPEILKAISEAESGQATGQPPPGTPNNGGQAPMPEPGMQPDGNLVPSGDAIQQPGVQPGGEVAGFDTNPQALAGMVGGAGV